MAARPGAARSLIAIAIAAALASTLAACGDSGGASDGEAADPTVEVDRGAEEQDVPGDWDVQFTVSLTNHSAKPVEVGVSLDPRPGGIKEQSVTASPASSFVKVGANQVVVVPAGSDAQASQVDLTVKQKLSTPKESKSTNAPAAIGEVHDLLISLPTAQVRFKTTYYWASSDCQSNNMYPYGQETCDNTRGSTVNVQTRYGNGWQFAWQPAGNAPGIGSCTNPVAFVDKQSPVANPASAWNSVGAANIHTVGIEIRSPEKISDDIADRCATGDLSLIAPGMSLSTPGDKAPAEPLNLTDRRVTTTQLPGAQLQWVNLQGVHFEGAAPANLAYADLSHATLYGTVFLDSILTGANFEGANLNAATSFDGAVLYDVDLTKANISSTLEWSAFDNTLFCRTVLPEATLASWKTKFGEDLDPNKSCGNAISASIPPTGGFIVDTSSATPLTLLQQVGSFDCAMSSTVGSFASEPASATACHGTYGSSMLPEVGGSPATGTVAIANGIPSSPTGGLATNPTPIASWGGIVCSAAAIDPAIGGCSTSHRMPGEP